MSFNGINIVDVLAKKTTERPEVTETIKSAGETVAKKVINSDDFDDQIDDLLLQGSGEALPAHIPAVEPEVVEPEEEEFDTEQSAEALIDLIDVTQKAIFMFFGAKKLKKQIPEDVMAQFISLDIKEMRGEELDDTEKKQLQRYKDFSHRLDRLAADTPFTDEEKADLMKCSESFVKKNGIKIPPSLWFGAQVVSIISQRAINQATL